MNKVYLSLGSNLGNRRRNLEKALNLLEASGNRINSASQVYETEPWGNQDQPKFLNQAVGLRTGLEAEVLLEGIHFIEEQFGRKRGKIRYAPRIIDIDILFYNSLIQVTEKLIIPHPLIQQRLFVLIPMADIAPDFVHPVLGKTIRELITECTDQANLSLYR